MDCGDLQGVLSHTKLQLSWKEQKLCMVLEITQGLHYLQTLELKMIHRDLKSRNILVDSKAGLKFSDFGLSRSCTFDETMTVGVGTVRWTAPEVILGYDYYESVAIYSLGIVLTATDMGQVPFYDACTASGLALKEVSIAHEVAIGRLHLKFIRNCPPSILQIGKACLQQDSALRPTTHIYYTH